MTLTVRLDSATTCSGEVVITTDLPGAAATCRVPVNVVVLATGTCDPEEPCATYFDDAFDGTTGTGIDSRAAGDITPVNSASLTYGTTQSCNTDTGADPGATWRWELASSVLVEDTTAGLAQYHAAWNPIEGGLPDNFCAKLGGQQEGGSSLTFMTGFVFGIAAHNDWYAAGTQKFLACDAGYGFQGIAIARMHPTDGWSLLASHCLNAGGYVLGLHVVGGVAKIAVQVGSGALSGYLLDSGDPNHVFDPVPITNGGTGLGLIMVNRHSAGWSAGAGPGIYFRELCITNQPGLAPQWEA
jgi:hypothetical protein